MHQSNGWRDKTGTYLQPCSLRGLVFCSIPMVGRKLEKLCLSDPNVSRLRQSESDACSCFLLIIIWG